MSSPFYIFDPFLLKFNIILITFSFFSFPYFFISYNTKRTIFLNLGKNIVFELFPKINFFCCGYSNFLLRLFFIIAVINLTSLFPNIFSPIVHIIVTLIIRQIVWFSLIIYQVNFFLTSKITHLSSKNTPIWLILFINLIEFISQIIRLLTLRVRLTANLTAGHLLLGLLSWTKIFLSTLIQIPVVILEIIVSLIQPFVFCLLILLYFQET